MSEGRKEGSMDGGRVRMDGARVFSRKVIKLALSVSNVLNCLNRTCHKLVRHSLQTYGP